jgi:hypothetical protein
LTRTRLTLAAVVLCLAAASARGVEDPVFAKTGIASNYSPQVDPRVPTPEKFLGFRIGDRFVTHPEALAYARAVAAAAPDRVHFETFGKTPEGRELFLLVITAPENHAKMDALVAANRAVWSPLPGKKAAPAAGQPLFVWFSYGIHGDEASSPDAAMATVYHLAASRDAETAEWLRRVVLTIDPMLNPDGRMRYLAWLTSSMTGAPDPNPDSREHFPVWPRGRTNHFGFDMNRDWSAATQVETRARLARLIQTPPQVVVDFHEMSPESSYFFPPVAEPTNRLLPQELFQWFGVFGKANAAAFDARGWGYFIRETYDFFYPGYTDAWPSFNGAIGMTYEMAGGPRSGLAYKRKDGTVLTLKERALKHFTTGLATLKTAAERRDEILRDFASARTSSLAAPNRVWTFPADQDAYRLRLLAETLQLQGVEVKRTAAASADLPAGSLVVEKAQPSGTLVAALLDEKAELTEPFLQKERQKFLRGEDEAFYDVTAWSLPAAFGLKASKSNALPKVGMEEAAPAAGAIKDAGARLGYIVRNPGLGAFPILARCAEKKVPVNVAARSFKVGERGYEAGTLFLRREGAPSDLDEVVANLAGETGVPFEGVASAWTEDGITLGSGWFLPWKPSRVALLAGPGVDRLSAGWALDAFHRVFRYPVTVIDPDTLGEAELSAYDVIIVPDSGSRVIGALTRSNGDALKAWVRSGGTLVGVGGGSSLLRDKEIGLSKATDWKSPRDREEKKKDGDEKEAAKKPVATEDPDLENRRLSIPGAIFKTKRRPEHFLLFGAEAEPRILLTTNAPLVPPDDPFRTVLSIAKEKPLWSGHAWPEAIDRMAGTPYLLAESAGRGWAITFLDDPNFRGFWLGTSLFFGNAAIFAPSFEP